MGNKALNMVNGLGCRAWAYNNPPFTKEERVQHFPRNSKGERVNRIEYSEDDFYFLLMPKAPMKVQQDGTKIEVPSDLETPLLMHATRPTDDMIKIIEDNASEMSNGDERFIKDKVEEFKQYYVVRIAERDAPKDSHLSDLFMIVQTRDVPRNGKVKYRAYVKNPTNDWQEPLFAGIEGFCSSPNQLYEQLVGLDETETETVETQEEEAVTA